MKTLQECKDEVARKQGFDDFADYRNYADAISLFSLIDEAAELYARSTWDAACEAQLKNLAVISFPPEIIAVMRKQHKPEFTIKI